MKEYWVLFFTRLAGIRDTEVRPYNKERDRRSVVAYSLGAVVVTWYAVSAHYVTRHWEDISWVAWNQTFANVLAVYILLSQPVALHMTWHVFPRIRDSLRATQKLVSLTTVLCVPADSLIMLAAPYDLLFTVGILFFVTLYFGVFLCRNYQYLGSLLDDDDERKLRGASSDEVLRSSSINLRMLSERAARKTKRLVNALRDYRPPADLRASTHAWVFARHFIVWCVTITEVQGELRDKRGPNRNWIVAGLGIGALSASLDMFLVLLVPGIALMNWDLLEIQCLFDAIEIVVAVIITADCADSLNNHIMVNLLLGVATVNLLERVSQVSTHYAAATDAFIFGPDPFRKRRRRDDEEEEEESDDFHNALPGDLIHLEICDDDHDEKKAPADPAVSSSSSSS